MTDSDVTSADAPDLDTPTDANVGGVNSQDLQAVAGEPAGATDAEQTMDTPDELGGTGGEQAGGAG
jgi:hypothetical protein